MGKRVLGNRDKRQVVFSMLAVLLCLGIFYAAIFNKEMIEGVLGLIYPLSLAMACFFVGVMLEGTVRGGLRKASIFLGLLALTYIIGMLRRP